MALKTYNRTSFEENKPTSFHSQNLFIWKKLRDTTLFPPATAKRLAGPPSSPRQVFSILMDSIERASYDYHLRWTYLNDSDISGIEWWRKVLTCPSGKDAANAAERGAVPRAQRGCTVFSFPSNPARSYCFPLSPDFLPPTKKELQKWLHIPVAPFIFINEYRALCLSMHRKKHLVI